MRQRIGLGSGGSSEEERGKSEAQRPKRPAMYYGIDYCDTGGQLLEKGLWLSGMCAKCEADAKKMARRPVKMGKPTSAVL